MSLQMRLTLFAHQQPASQSHLVFGKEAERRGGPVARLWQLSMVSDPTRTDGRTDHLISDHEDALTFTPKDGDLFLLN